MPESILASNLVSKVDECIAQARLASQVEHAGMAGRMREVFLSQLIRPLLPEGFRAGTGKVIDRQGSLSNETDVVLYNKARFSPFMFDENAGIFPIDSVSYAIEVKSTVTAAEIRDAIGKAVTLRSLDGIPPNVVLFGFDSDLSTPEKDLARIQEYQADYQKPPVNVYCTVGQGYAYHDGQAWQVLPGIERRAEVVGLVIGVVNTLVNRGAAPRDISPGQYLAWWA